MFLQNTSTAAATLPGGNAGTPASLTVPSLEAPAEARGEAVRDTTRGWVGPRGEAVRDGPRGEAARDETEEPRSCGEEVRGGPAANLLV